MPPSASSKRPTRSARASVNAPFTCPKSSLSKTPSEIPPAFNVTSGRPARPEAACRARATTPFPVPFSPRMSTLASDGPTRAIISSTGRIEGDCAMIDGSGSRRRMRFSASRRCALPQRLPEGDLRAQRRQQARVLPGLLDEVARPAPHRLDGQIDAAPGRHDDDGQRGVDLLDPREQLQPFRPRGRVPGVVQVHQTRRRSPARADAATTRRGRRDAVSLSKPFAPSAAGAGPPARRAGRRR